MTTATKVLLSPWRLNVAIAVASSALFIASSSASFSLIFGTTTTIGQQQQQQQEPWSTRTWIAVITVALTATPLVALLQGMFALLHFRLFYKDAPVPKTPSHGVVVLVDNNSSEPNPTPFAFSNNCSCCLPPRPNAAQQYGSVSSSSSTTTTTSSSTDEDPIRVLVIGDSLAIGVGQSRSCCPILPETIAKSLCRYFGGKRPVFWSCHGAPGASAGWIVRELEQRLPSSSHHPNNTSAAGGACAAAGGGGGGLTASKSSSLMLQRTFSTAATATSVTTTTTTTNSTTTDESCSETRSTTSSISSDDVDDNSDDESGNESDGYRKVAFDMPCSSSSSNSNSSRKSNEDGSDHDPNSGGVSLLWKQRLSEHAGCLENNPLDGHYDIVVLMTGSNDLKSAIFPFLLTGDDVEFRKQAQERGGSYTRELCRVLQVLQPRLRRRQQQQQSQQQQQPHGAHDDNNQNDDDDDDNKHQSLLSSSSPASPIPRLPLVVLPGMPAEALPIFRPYPLHWAAIPVVNYMDHQKRKLAESRPDQVLFVPPPSLQEICDFESQCDRLLPELHNDDEFVQLRDVTPSECRRIRDQMNWYYSSSAAATANNNNNNKKDRTLPLSQRSGQPGTKIVSLDSVHPNDEGYDFWGRYIANAIVQEWEKQQT